ncbi:hypothetical protein N431DRAFT_462533 [Stipitochalara longipes BDJ]|nr:hypothetical protein N431DRAFT_462533 [Stipitochalara longipes BDJ]
MASQLVSRAPQCLSCIRRMTGSLRDVFQVPICQQIRGKKRLVKVSTVKVHLLQNVPGYGRRGAVIPVTAGMMRNIWYPKKMAEYLTGDKLQQLGMKNDTSIERDSTFRSNTERKFDKEKERLERNVATESVMASIEPESTTPMQLDLLSPERSMTVLENLIPPNLDFYRVPVTVADIPQKRISPSIRFNSVISAAASEIKEPQKPEVTNIYGSVTTMDIAANLKAILAEDEDGVRVVLSPEDVSFVEETSRKNGVKHLGIFEIDIKLDGAPEAIRRTIRVNAQD